MSTADYAVVPSSFENASASFIAANALIAKILIDQYLPAAETATTPMFYGGCTVIDLTAVSTDTVAKDILMYHGIVGTTQEATKTAAMATTTGGISRVNGSFIADGFKVGDQVMTFAAPGVVANAAVDGILATITAITATNITVNGTPFAAGALGGGTRVCRVALDLRATLPIGAGTNNTANNPSIGLLNHAQDGSLMRYERKISPNEVLILAMQAAVSALPGYVSASAQIARY
jgi:hypothetical protein